MLFENVKNILRSLFSYFNIEGAAVSVRSYVLLETPDARTDFVIPPEGSSVDPVPLLSVSKIETAPRHRDTLSSLDDSNEPGECSENGEESTRADEDAGAISAVQDVVEDALSKVSLCADTLSQELCTDAEKNPSSIEEAVDDKAALRPETSSADASAGEGTCLLYRLFPSASPTANPTTTAQTHVQIRGEVTFNSPLFSEGDFNLRIIHEKVCLEFVQIDPKQIHGYVRVLNTTYDKDVTVHYTVNDWETTCSRKAEWTETVSEGTMDRFAFTIPGRESAGDLSFSITFNGIADANKGRNYTVAYKAL